MKLQKNLPRHRFSACESALLDKVFFANFVHLKSKEPFFHELCAFSTTTNLSAFSDKAAK
jgi:hypothetical protein